MTNNFFYNVNNLFYDEKKNSKKILKKERAGGVRKTYKKDISLKFVLLHKRGRISQRILIFKIVVIPVIFDVFIPL